MSTPQQRLAARVLTSLIYPDYPGGPDLDTPVAEEHAKAIETVRLPYHLAVELMLQGKMTDAPGDAALAWEAIRTNQPAMAELDPIVRELGGALAEQHGAPKSKAPAKEYVVSDWKAAGITLAELQHKEFVPERWIVEDILPEGACLLAAKPKSKKSWLSLGLGIAIAMGGRALGRLSASRARVLYLDLEGKQLRIKKRTRSILGVQNIAWPDNFHVYTKWPQGDLGLAQLRGWFEAYPDTGLVVIDVLGNFRRPIEKHEAPYQYDRDTVTPLNELLEHYHAAGILVHHLNKAKNDDVMDSISGTTGLPSAVNTMWALGRDVNDSSITVFSMRGRDLENDDPLALKWDPYLNIHVIEGNAAEVAISVERRAVLGILEDDQARTPKEIATELSKPVNPVQQLLRKLVNEGSIDKVGYGKYAIVRKRDQTDQTDQSSHADQTDHSDRDLPTLIGGSTTDQSSVSFPDAVNTDSDRSDRYIKGGFLENPFWHVFPKNIRQTTRMMLYSPVERNNEIARERCAQYGVNYEEARRIALEESRKGQGNGTDNT